jgi:hypothetical protein
MERINNKPKEYTETRGFRILGLTHGLASNNRRLIHNPVYFAQGEIYTQITNWEVLEAIEYGPGMDSYCFLLDDPTLPYEIKNNVRELYIYGDLSRLEREGVDKRWSILGNVGVWFRFALAIQEQHGIFSLHASSIYKPKEDELLIIVGKAGAGKTVYLLESLLRGYQIFSTEMTYFQFTPEGIVFYRGALMDNIRVGCFLYDFPEAGDLLGLSVPEVDHPWDVKISVSMHPTTTERSSLVNPKISIIFPHIDSGIERAVVRDINSPRKLTRMLFESASEKIGSTMLMYEAIPVMGFDTPTLAGARWEAVADLVAARQWEIKQARTILACPKSCLEVIDK